MKVVAGIFAVAAFGMAGAGAWYLAGLGAEQLEAQTEGALGSALSAAGQDWVEVEADGLVATLSGTAPSEAARFRALDVAEAVLRSEQIVDDIVLADAKVAPPTPLTLDMLMTRETVILVGDTPESEQAAFDAMVDALERRVVDLTRPVPTPPSADWNATYGLLADIVPQIETGQVIAEDGALSVEAALPDAALREALIAEIEAAAPEGQDVTLALSAPRMTLSPYPFDLSVGEGGFRLTACAAPDEEEARTILRVVSAATGLNDLDCPVALGAPDEDWTAAVTLGVEMLVDLADAELSLRDRVMVLRIGADVPEARAANIVERARPRLPEGYSLLTETAGPDPDAPGGPVEAAPPMALTLTIAPGRLVASGAVGSTEGVETLESYAVTAFPGREIGFDLIAVDPGAAPPLADALALLDSLAQLDQGTIRVDETTIAITGRGPGEDVGARMEAALETRLTGGRTLSVEVEEYTPVAAGPVVTSQPEIGLTPEQCAAEIGAAQRGQRITFAPSSATLDPGSAGPLDEIARLLATCPQAVVEIAAFTDSSGGEEMNLRISQQRADSVLDALLARGVFLDRMTAIGYGEASPIATNETAEGREANRRIEFVLSAPGDDAAADPPPAEEEETE